MSSSDSSNNQNTQETPKKQSSGSMATFAVILVVAAFIASPLHKVPSVMAFFFVLYAFYLLPYHKIAPRSKLYVLLAGVAVIGFLQAEEVYTERRADEAAIKEQAASTPPVKRAQPAKDSRPDATAEQAAQMTKMSDSELLDHADKLLAGTNVSQISREHEDEAAMYMREFDRRHPNSADKHAKKTGERLVAVTLTRNVSERAAALDANPPKITAEVMCRATVRENLKAPSTAEFYGDDYIKYLGKGRFHIQTQADAQNSFGAKIRSTFDCQVQCVDADTCTVTKLKEI